MHYTNSIAIAGLLVGAGVWGLIWYPYRALSEAAIPAELSTLLTYAGAYTFAALLFGAKAGVHRTTGLLAAIALSAGWANIGFTLAVIHGDVMRVVLLFYLAPVWTVIFARLLLGERLSSRGYCLMLLAISGAVVMLWNPASGLPLPATDAEWIAMSAGLMFALSNVLARKAQGMSVEEKVLAVFAGCAVVSAACMLLSQPVGAPLALSLYQLSLLLVLAVVLLSVNVAVQFSLSRVSANRAIVIYLFELVVAAISSWLLAGEALTLREWCGGAMIVVAGLFSADVGNEATGKMPDRAPA